MNPAVIGFIRHGITMLATLALANTDVSPEDINTLASGAVILINLGWFAYDQRHNLKRKLRA